MDTQSLGNDTKAESWKGAILAGVPHLLAALLLVSPWRH